MRPEYRNNRDDAPRPVAAMAKTFADGDHIPLHLHKRGQLIHAVTGTMKVETAEAAWIVPPALALWMPPAYPHGMVMRGELAMRTIYIDPEALSRSAATPMLVEVGGLMRELILAALEEPLDYDEAGRGGLIAQLILAELGAHAGAPMHVPMPRDPRAIRVARALLEQPDADGSLDDWAERAGASRRTLARLFRLQTGFSFNEWRARLRAIDGLARLSNGDPVGTVALGGRLCEPKRLHGHGRRNFGERRARRMVHRRQPGRNLKLHPRRHDTGLWLAYAGRLASVAGCFSCAAFAWPGGSAAARPCYGLQFRRARRWFRATTIRLLFFTGTDLWRHGFFLVRRRRVVAGRHRPRWLHVQGADRCRLIPISVRRARRCRSDRTAIHRLCDGRLSLRA